MCPGVQYHPGCVFEPFFLAMYSTIDSMDVLRSNTLRWFAGEFAGLGVFRLTLSNNTQILLPHVVEHHHDDLWWMNRRSWPCQWTFVFLTSFVAEGSGLDVAVSWIYWLGHSSRVIDSVQQYAKLLLCVTEAQVLDTFLVLAHLEETLAVPQYYPGKFLLLYSN